MQDIFHFTLNITLYDLTGISALLVGGYFLVNKGNHEYLKPISMHLTYPLLSLVISLVIHNDANGQTADPPPFRVHEDLSSLILPLEDAQKTDDPFDEKLTPDPAIFIPAGGIAFLTEKADIDLFTKGKDVGNVQDDPEQTFRRLVQRTVMPTEDNPFYGCTLTFDDQLVADDEALGNAIDIVKDLAPLRARAIFFANVPEVSGKSVNGIMARNATSEKRLAECKKLLESKRMNFIKIIRELIRVKFPADKNGNAEYACDVFNHTAFHQNMGQLKVGSDRYKMCIMGIEFIEECIDAAYEFERPGWKRARYFRFPFLAAPKYQETQNDLNKKFTELGLVSLGQTQDSKDFDNFSPSLAYLSIAAAKESQRYNPSLGKYGETEKPIALFHIKTWPRIKSGVIKAVTEKPKTLPVIPLVDELQK